MCAPEGDSDFWEKKTHYFRRKYTLSALLYSKERKITFTIIVFHDMTINQNFLA